MNTYRTALAPSLLEPELQPKGAQPLHSRIIKFRVLNSYRTIPSVANRPSTDAAREEKGAAL
jgi:hypothetical protein